MTVLGSPRLIRIRVISVRLFVAACVAILIGVTLYSIWIPVRVREITFMAPTTTMPPPDQRITIEPLTP